MPTKKSRRCQQDESAEALRIGVAHPTEEEASARKQKDCRPDKGEDAARVDPQPFG
jgi:hypothetical protein